MKSKVFNRKTKQCDWLMISDERQGHIWSDLFILFVGLLDTGADFLRLNVVIDVVIFVHTGVLLQGFVNL